MLNSTNFRRLAVQFALCPLCRGSRPFVRLDDDEIAVRCLGCRATPVTLSLVDVLRRVCPKLHAADVYEQSARGPLVKFLRRNAGSLTCSQYFVDVAPGDHRDGVQCQDVRHLTFPDESFDVCTSTEVFEHVPDDRLGFSEIHRVLRPGGVLVFTVPIDPGGSTVERARLDSGGAIEHLHPPEFHGDPALGHALVLTYRNYGGDIVERLSAAGFARAGIMRSDSSLPWGYERPVIVAFRGEGAQSPGARTPATLEYGGPRWCDHH